MKGKRIGRGRRAMARARIATATAAALGVALGAAPGCGQERPRPPPATPAEAELGQPLPAAPESADDAVVARVDGLPVYASCVAHQAAAALAREAALPPPHPVRSVEERRRQALEECIGFELLAQEAAARRLRDDDVEEARRRAAVSRLIEQEIDEKIQSPAGLPPAFTARVLERNRWRLHRVDYRASVFARFTVPEREAAGSPADQAARAAAERLAAALADERGLYPSHLFAAARAAAQGAPLEEGNVKLTDADRLVPSYARALFDIPEIGRISQPVRTQWGWDVLLWTEQLPPRDISEAELAAELFPDSRLAYFAAWSKAAGRGVAVQLNPQAGELLARLASEEVAAPPEGQPSAPAASPASLSSPAAPPPGAPPEARP
jgi:hypothetical protein